MNERICYYKELEKIFFDNKRTLNIETNNSSSSEKKIVSLKLTESFFVESKPSKSEIKAKNDLARKAINHIRELKFRDGNINGLKPKIKKIIIMLTFLMFIILLDLLVHGNGFKIAKFLFLLSIFLFFGSPFLIFYDYQIARCISEKGIPIRGLIIENKYYESVLIKGDLLLISPIEYTPLKVLTGVILTAKLLEDIELNSSGNNDEFPFCTLKKGTWIGVSKIDAEENYFIDFTTYQRDGILRRYIANITQSGFKKKDEPIHLNVFSKNGRHLHQEKHIERLTLNIWEWYIEVLSINKLYFQSTLSFFL
ncbi:hypothetical protein ACTFIU_010921 [Dictyostelium citrinum]